MKGYTVVPMFQDGTTRYAAPKFYVSASNSGDAYQEAIKHSGLSRFAKWKFHVIETSKDNNSELNKSRNKIKNNHKFIGNKNSKSQKGKQKTGHANSRPVRRALRRLASAQGITEQGQRKAGAMKMW